MTDDLMKRLRDLATEFKGQGGKYYTAELFTECADRIEAQATRLAEADALIELQNQDIERLREALVTVRARIEDIENPFEDGAKQEHTAFEKAVDAAHLIAMEVLEETLHVTETCKENGESFT